MNFSDWIADWAQASVGVAPEAARAEAHLAMLDTVACMFAGRDGLQAERALRAVRRSGDTGRVVPVGGGPGLTLGAAAMINGTRAHALDFDDYEAAGSTHPSATILGALLALAQSENLTVAEVTQAWLVGYEVIVRIGEALGYGHYLNGWHATSTLGPIGTAAAVAVAIGLDARHISTAMSLATSSSAGLKVQFGTDTKALHAGFAARAGLQAALLAESGATAAADVWERQFGFADLYGARSSKRFRAVVESARLGAGVQDFPVLRKPWPSCAYTHRSIEAATDIHAQLAPEPSQFSRVTVRMPEPFARVAGIMKATTPSEGRFSTVYCVATALLNGAVGPSDFTDEAVARSDVQELASRIEFDRMPMPDGLEDMSSDAPDTVEVTLRDGRTASRTIGEVRGGPARPMTSAEIEAKFVACGGSVALADELLSGGSDAKMARSAIFAVPA